LEMVFGNFIRFTYPYYSVTSSNINYSSKMMKYQKLSQLIKKAYAGKSAQEAQMLLNKEWSKAKVDQATYDAVVQKLELRIARVARRRNEL